MDIISFFIDDIYVNQLIANQLIADLFLHLYETELIGIICKSGRENLARSFDITFCYRDDALSLNNAKFSDYADFSYIDLSIA